MTEFDDRVERQRILLEAEEWADGVKQMHAHSLKSCWYDDRPQDTDDGGVLDVQYNDGRIERTKDGKVIHIWDGEVKEGDDLIAAYLSRGK